MPEIGISPLLTKLLLTQSIHGTQALRLSRTSRTCYAKKFMNNALRLVMLLFPFLHYMLKGSEHFRPGRQQFLKRRIESPNLLCGEIVHMFYEGIAEVPRAAKRPLPSHQPASRRIQKPAGVDFAVIVRIMRQR